MVGQCKHSWPVITVVAAPAMCTRSPSGRTASSAPRGESWRATRAPTARAGPPSRGRPSTGPSRWPGPRRCPHWARRPAARSRRPSRARPARGEQQGLGPGGRDGGQVGPVVAHGGRAGQGHEGEEAGPARSTATSDAGHSAGQASRAGRMVLEDLGREVQRDAAVADEGGHQRAAAGVEGQGCGAVDQAAPGARRGPRPRWRGRTGRSRWPGENQRRPKVCRSSLGVDVGRLGDAQLVGQGLHGGRRPARPGAGRTPRPDCRRRASALKASTQVIGRAAWSPRC